MWCVWECVHTPCACSSTQRWRGPAGKVVGPRVCPLSPWPLSAEPPPEQTSPGWPASGPDPWWRWSHAATVCQEQVKHTSTWGADKLFLFYLKHFCCEKHFKSTFPQSTTLRFTFQTQTPPAGLFVPLVSLGGCCGSPGSGSTTSPVVLSASREWTPHCPE